MTERRAQDDPEVTVRLINERAGDPGDAILDLVKKTHVGLIASWSGGEGGNCFFASVQTMVEFIRTQASDGFMLVTGMFDFPDRDPVFHCWLEKGNLVLNVSNILLGCPVYVISRAEYYDRNYLARRIQQINPKRIRRGLKRHGGDVRVLTRAILQPTMWAANDSVDPGWRENFLANEGE